MTVLLSLLAYVAVASCILGIFNVALACIFIFCDREGEKD